jgi:hypothetical protein
LYLDGSRKIGSSRVAAHVRYKAASARTSAYRQDGSGSLRGVGAADGVGVTVGDGGGDGEGRGVSQGASERVGDGDGEGGGVEVGVADGAGVAEGVGEGEGLGLGAAEGVGRGVSHGGSGGVGVGVVAAVPADCGSSNAESGTACADDAAEATIRLSARPSPTAAGIRFISCIPQHLRATCRARRRALM